MKKVKSKKQIIIELFDDPEFFLIAYKQKKIRLIEAVAGLLCIKQYTTKELCEILEIESLNDLFRVNYSRRLFYSGKYWKDKIDQLQCEAFVKNNK